MYDNVIFLSAQPDTFYFTWQLEIMLHNFNKHGIAPANIHILIGTHPEAGLSLDMQRLINRNKQEASFYVYQDDPHGRTYVPAVRPFLIRKHFEANPDLEGRPIFYHDSDIIFRELPAFNILTGDDSWYVSDARSYLDLRYLRQHIDEAVIADMCRIVGIEMAMLTAKDAQCGGAQYLMKGLTASFWEKIEADSTAIYQLLNTYNRKQANMYVSHDGGKASRREEIQSWCADMWALLWNGWKMNRTVLISSELAFCCAPDPIECWYGSKILHYTGAVAPRDKRYFRKLNYVNCSPFDDADLRLVARDSCSYPLMQEVLEINTRRKQHRINLTDVSFLLAVRVDSVSRLQNLLAVVATLDKYFDTNILIQESGPVQQVPEGRIPDGCHYRFVSDISAKFNHTHVNNQLIECARTSIICLHDTDIVLSIEQVVSAVARIRSKQAEMVYPYDGEFISVDHRLKQLFLKILDPDLLVLNKKKFMAGSKRSFGGIVFIDRQVYIRCGMDNPHFKSWGAEDIERVKRVRTFGHRIERIPGPVYHLAHERTQNSGYQNDCDYMQSMGEYLKVCNMKRPELAAYVATWCRSQNQENNETADSSH